MREFRKVLCRIQTRNVEIHNKLMCASFSLKNSKNNDIALRDAKSILRDTDRLIVDQNKDITYSEKYMEIDEKEHTELNLAIIELKTLNSLKQEFSNSLK